jgi:hypothetical protein
LRPARFFNGRRPASDIAEARKLVFLSQIVATTRANHFHPFTFLSRNDGAFLLILSETRPKHGRFLPLAIAPII